jgi:RNA polymerase sigma-54 factor
MLRIQQQLRQQLRLTPQQVQYLKLLQLPTMALEQRIKTELEVNPMLEEVIEPDLQLDQEEPFKEEEPVVEERMSNDDQYSLEDFMNDNQGGYKSPDARNWTDDDERPEPQIEEQVPPSEQLLRQFRLQNSDETDFVIAEEIIGNIDEDGYLKRQLEEITQDINLSFSLDIDVAHAEKVLKAIQLLDPPGIAARTLQECLIAQTRCASMDKAFKEVVLKTLTQHFKLIEDKHFDALLDTLNIGRETLKKIVEFIQRLNPKPGVGHFSAQENYLIPDFIVEKDEKENFLITLNDRNTPTLRVDRTYQLMMHKKKSLSPDTRDFIRKKFEAAKFFISSIQQRRETLVRVMKMIVERQRLWFDGGKTLKPMIYKDIAEEVGYDISTISRVVTSKYVQTEFGVFSLRHFFTSGMTADNGEDLSASTIKDQLKEIIAIEDSQHPLSDDELTKQFKRQGLTIARRTIAKYREQLNIPIARLRRKLT